MKRKTLRIATLSLCLAAMVAVPALSHAEDTSTNAPAASSSQTAPRKHNKILVFRGTVDVIDTNAMTLTVGKRKFEITSSTKIAKDGQPATFDEGVMGEPVAGAYKKEADGTLEAVTIHFGRKKKESSGSGN